MQRGTERTDRPADPRLLFEEYLAGLDAGAPPDPRELAARAGPRAGELLERFELMRVLEAALRLLAGGFRR